MNISEPTNKCTRPYILTKSTYSWNAVSEQRPDGLWQYTVSDATNFRRGTVRGTMYSTATGVGDVLALIYECDDPVLLLDSNAGGSYCMRGCEYVRGGTVSDRVGWVACRIVDTTFPNHEFCIHVDAGWVTLRGCANYTAADWPRIETILDKGILPTAWFAPPQNGAPGVSYPPALMP